jgi:hypothetical protein
MGLGHPHTLAMEFDDGTLRGCCEAAALATAVAAVRAWQSDHRGLLSGRTCQAHLAAVPEKVLAGS